MPTYPVHTSNASTAQAVPLLRLTPMQARALRQVQVHHAALLLARQAQAQAQQQHVASQLRHSATLGAATVAPRRKVATRAARAYAHAQARVLAAQRGYTQALQAAQAQGIPAGVARRSAHALGMASIRAY